METAVSASRAPARVAIRSCAAVMLLLAGGGRVDPAGAAQQTSIRWTSPNAFRLLLTVDTRGRARSNSPAAVEVDFHRLLAKANAPGRFDEHTLEVIALTASGEPRIFDATRRGNERLRVPHRLDRLFGSTKATLNFVMPDHATTNFAVYFDTVESSRGQPRRVPGLVGDGDLFSEGFSRREISASHFDHFFDFDGDGDLDLFKGGVEPSVYCYENVGKNRYVPRGKLTSGGEVLVLPHSKDNRSWVTVAFHDWDGDGQPDFLPSFNDGPDTGRIVLYRNTTREHGGVLTFERIGSLTTVSGVPLAGGAQAGGWFPSIAFATNLHGDGRTDVLVGSGNHCWLHRNLGTNAAGVPLLADAVPVQANGTNIVLINPRFDVADFDGDGLPDLFAATQPGPVWFYRNMGTRGEPSFASAVAVAWVGRYLIGDAHSGVKVADFDGDGRLDVATGRFWQRAHLDDPRTARDSGALLRNVGSRYSWSLPRDRAHAPFTELFQPCDAVRQNCVRAVDWDGDGKLDLLAGDTDGFIWFFRNEGSAHFPVFAAGEMLRAAGRPLSLAASGGHARLDVCDWNNDGKPDLVVADGGGTVTLFINTGTKSHPTLAAGRLLEADWTPVQVGSRASVLVCDWDNDGRKDVVVADESRFLVFMNEGSDAAPLLAAGKDILFRARRVNYVRPNLGSFVDWDGDGRRDFIVANFENNIRLYQNIGLREHGGIRSSSNRRARCFCAAPRRR